MNTLRVRRTSKAIRQNEYFLRNDFNGNCAWDIPKMKKSTVCDPDIQFLSYGNTKPNDYENVNKTVHFFLDDDKIDCIYKYPERYYEKLAQYENILTPDYSLYTDMPLAMQLDNVFRSRWCGAKWQELGLSVIPTVSWSTDKSFEFCFLGLEKGTAVAISTVGALKDKKLFMKGYNEMCKQIFPETIYCFGKPFTEMDDKVFFVNYEKVTRRI